LKQFASVRFADVLAASERAAATRTLRSAGAIVTSWNEAGGRTYARLALAAPDASARTSAAFPGARVDTPPIVVLRVIPDAPRRLPALAHAFAGAGRPAGVAASATEENAFVVEIDARTTQLATIVALVDIETGARERRIEPVLPLEDDTLAAFAGSVLGEPSLDAARILEPYVEAILERGGA
jgi:hypothetical protein